ncbi:hypothetical protein [Nonomuraea turcica]|uniref:hypothetical protein n=1 Tax=Nonomuraea sp. G32 TaxID=3067274 RepID=UPI00273BAB76|nr:hypothetical protein [Nonomuraea sp. G32]MDP4501106.1 hypothetical protein [Nonomuraea sp. G32]
MSKKTNIAKSGYTPVQVGRVVPPGDNETQSDTNPETPKPPRKTGKERTVNMQVGRGRVGVQADTIVGDINIQM